MFPVAMKSVNIPLEVWVLDTYVWKLRFSSGETRHFTRGKIQLSCRENAPWWSP